MVLFFFILRILEFKFIDNAIISKWLLVQLYDMVSSSRPLGDLDAARYQQNLTCLHPVTAIEVCCE